MCRREDRDGKEERVSMQRDLSTSNWELIAKSYGHGISKRHGSQQHKKGGLGQSTERNGCSGFPWFAMRETYRSAWLNLDPIGEYLRSRIPPLSPAPARLARTGPARWRRRTATGPAAHSCRQCSRGSSAGYQIPRRPGRHAPPSPCRRAWPCPPTRGRSKEIVWNRGFLWSYTKCYWKF